MDVTKRWTLVVVCAATAMLMLDIAVVNTALSRIAEDLDTGLTGLQWVVDAYTLALASVVLTAGALADRLGRKRMFIGGLGLFTVASLACALAQDIVMLNTSRAIQGIGAAVMFAVSLALLANAFPDTKERAGALAAYGATIGGAFAIGPLVGGALTSGLDWQWIFLINIPVGLAAIAITRKYVVESRDPKARRIDWARPGAAHRRPVPARPRAAARQRGRLDEHAHPGRAGRARSRCSAPSCGGSSTRREPMLPIGLFKNGAFTGAQVAAFAISSSFFAIFLYITLYLQQVLGLTRDRGRARLPAGHDHHVRRLRRDGQLGEKVSPRMMIGVGLTLVGVGHGRR